jgi:SAM-dependent methyltransferase
MAKLYEGKMAKIFDAMYQVFINYDEEYLFYNRFLKEINSKNVLEIGCGTGNLAKRFISNNHDYLGIDLSASMLKIAIERNPKGNFIEADMRNFKINSPKDSILITGRTTSYLISNNDIHTTFSSVYKNLSPNGIFIFDFIDANRYIPFVLKNKDIKHEALVNGKLYSRTENWIPTPKSENFMLDWSAQYYKINNNKKTLISKDFSTVRVFTLNEIQLFLHQNGFEIIKTIDRKTYAYDTFVILSKKILN